MKLAAFALIILAVGCDRNSELKNIVHLPSNVVIEKPVFANERFVPTNTSALAFDTQTGVLCKTYRWRDDRATYGDTSIANNAPVCSDIPLSERQHAENLAEYRLRQAEEDRKDANKLVAGR
jgi:hypothetical protein